jgi:hypothetical protein
MYLIYKTCDFSIWMFFALPLKFAAGGHIYDDNKKNIMNSCLQQLQLQHQSQAAAVCL